LRAVPWRISASVLRAISVRATAQHRTNGAEYTGRVDDELVAAIVAAPDDDAPRLVYADCLMQRGDPRGELIALQCRLAAGEASPEIVAHELELRAALAPALLEPLHAIAPAGYELRRGFVEHAELLRAEIPDELFARAPLLRSLGVRGAVIDRPLPACVARLDALALHELGASRFMDADHIAAFTASPHVARLRRLEITNGRLDDAALAALVAIAAPLEHLRIDVAYPYERFGNNPARLLEQVAVSPARASLHALEVVGFAARAIKRPLAKLQSARPDLRVSTRVVRVRSPARFPAALQDCLDNNLLIQSIKLFREWTGAGLAESKVAVERILGREPA